MNFAKVILASVIGLASFSAVHAQTAGRGRGQNIVETAVSAGQFKTLVTAIGAAGLVGTLSGPGPFTVFAPTDYAFAKLPAGIVEGLLKDIPALKNILLYHVVAGDKIEGRDAVILDEATMANGEKVKIEFNGKDLFINQSKVVVTDIEASNGVIHVIDTVLFP